MATNEAQRPLDMSTFKISNLGTPTAANDATVTDNTTGPANPAASASAGASFLAAPANHVHQGVHGVRSEANAYLYGDVTLLGVSGISITQSGQNITLTGGGGGSNKLELGEDEQVSMTGTSEEILREYYLSFDSLAAGNVSASLTGVVKVAAGTGTYKLYVGATAPGATTGGTVRATFTSTSTSFETKANTGSAFTNPTGSVLVQITAVNSGANKTTLRSFGYTIG
jgi:hypothetical protein